MYKAISKSAERFSASGAWGPLWVSCPIASMGPRRRVQSPGMTYVDLIGSFGVADCIIKEHAPPAFSPTHFGNHNSASFRLWNESSHLSVRWSYFTLHSCLALPPFVLFRAEFPSLPAVPLDPPPMLQKSSANYLQH